MSALRVVGRITAAFIAATLVVVLPALLLTSTALDVATSRGFLRSAMADTGLVEASMYEVADSLATHAPGDFQVGRMPISRLDRNGWERVLGTVFPPEDFKKWIDKFLSEFSRWAEEGGPFPGDIVVPYGQMVDNMVNDPEQKVLRTITEAQPPCSDDEAPLTGPGQLIPRCRPKAEALEAFYQASSVRWQENPKAAWEQLWPRNVNRYSEDITLADLIERENRWDSWNARNSWIVARWGLGLAQDTVLGAIALGSLLALGLIAVLASRNVREGLCWTGGTILAAGVMTLAFGMMTLAFGWAGTGWEGWDASISWEMRSAVYDVIQLFAIRVFIPLAAQSAILMIIGGALLGTSFLVPGQRPQAQVTTVAGGGVSVSQSVA